MAAGDPPQGIRWGARQDKARLGSWGCHGAEAQPLLCREQGVSLGVRVGQGLEETLPPSPARGCGHCGRLPESLLVQKQLPTSWLQEGAREVQVTCEQVNTSCDPRNAKPCGMENNRTIHPPAGKVITKTHDFEQEPRRNLIKLSISRKRVRNRGLPSCLRTGEARANTCLVPTASASKLSVSRSYNTGTAFKLPSSQNRQATP